MTTSSSYAFTTKKKDERAQSAGWIAGMFISVDSVNHNDKGNLRHNGADAIVSPHSDAALGVPRYRGKGNALPPINVAEAVRHIVA